MATVLTLPLRDGPLLDNHIKAMKACLTASMATSLLKDGSYASAFDARRTLRMAGFTAFDIEALLDDARQVAVQHRVAMEIAGP